MSEQPTTNRRPGSPHAAKAMNVNGTTGGQRQVDCIENASHPIERRGAAVRDRKTQACDLIAPRIGESSQFIVVANKRHAGVVRFVLYLQIDERPHACVEQRSGSLAMVRRIRTTGVGTSQQHAIKHPVRAVARRRFGRKNKGGWDVQSKTPEESGTMFASPAIRHRQKNA